MCIRDRVRGRPAFLFNAEPVALKFDTQTGIDFLSGTDSCQPSANRIRNARCVVTVSYTHLDVYKRQVNHICNMSQYHNKLGYINKNIELYIVIFKLLLLTKNKIMFTYIN